jgi:hypothetical protein
MTTNSFSFDKQVRHVSIVTFLALSVIAKSFAQDEIPTTKLMLSLPTLKSIGGLNRHAPTEDPGQVTVQYSKVEDEPPYYDVNIAEIPPSIQELNQKLKSQTDALATVIAKMGGEEDEEGRIHNYVTIQGKYKAEEVVSKMKDGDCQLTFNVGEKIGVTLRGVGTNNVKHLYTLLESMKLDLLEKL